MSTCKLCSQELTIELDPESFDEATSEMVGQEATKAPDDILLICGCHFHWQCLLDESPQVALSLACPACENSIVSTSPVPSTSHLLPAGTEQPQILTRYHNEGGIQERLDILPLIREEAYLDANPAARPARALMTMCSEGDVAGIVELLQAIQEDPEEGDMSPATLLRFQDPLEEGKTGLHVAIQRSQNDVVWLLLWLASSLPIEAFPVEVLQAAEAMGVEREMENGEAEVDIRSLTDELGQKPADTAASVGSVWAALLQAGILQG